MVIGSISYHTTYLHILLIYIYNMYACVYTDAGPRNRYDNIIVPKLVINMQLFSILITIDD